MKDLAWQIYGAARGGTLAEPFNAEAVARACPGWSAKSYRTVLSEHARNKEDARSQLFVRVRPGFYRVRTRASATWNSQ
jgi:hypothetical protein